MKFPSSHLNFGMEVKIKVNDQIVQTGERGNTNGQVNTTKCIISLLSGH